MQETCGGTLVAAVMHDDSLIKPKLKVKLDASDYTSKAAEEDGVIVGSVS